MYIPTRTNVISYYFLKKIELNHNFIYFNPAASLHTIPTVPLSPQLIPAIPWSKTCAILRWLEINEIYYLDQQSMHTTTQDLHCMMFFFL